jgi:hypothetical protein
MIIAHGSKGQIALLTLVGPWGQALFLKIGKHSLKRGGIAQKNTSHSEQWP